MAAHPRQDSHDVSPHHGRAQDGNEEEEEEDPFEMRVEKSGCAKFHYALQDCHYQHGDWRKCKKEMEDFKQCVDEQKRKK